MSEFPDFEYECELGNAVSCVLAAQNSYANFMFILPILVVPNVLRAV